MPELIDREATLKKMCETCGYCEKFEKAMRTSHPDFVTDKCNNYKFLAEQPTIQLEQRHGRWVILYCRNCGAKIDLRTPTEVELDIVDSVMMGDTDDGNSEKV